MSIVALQNKMVMCLWFIVVSVPVIAVNNGQAEYPLFDHKGNSVEKAIFLMYKGKRRKARALLETELQRHLNGSALKNPHSLMKIYLNLGLLYSYAGKYHKAVKFIRVAIDLEERHFGSRYFMLPDRYEKVGLAYVELKQYQNAIASFKKALAILNYWRARRNKSSTISSLSSANSDRAVLLRYIAHAYEKSGEVAKSKVMREQSLKIRTKALGLD